MNTRAGAQAYELCLRESLSKGEDISKSNAKQSPELTFKDFSDQWLKTYVQTNNKFSELVTKQFILKNHLVPWFGRTSLDAIQSPEIERYKAVKQTTLSAKTVNNHLIVLGKCLRTAEEWGHLNKLPKIRLLRTTPPPFDFLSEEELAQLLSDQAEPKWHLMVNIAAKTGMRRGELLALQWCDINIETGLITVRSSCYRGTITAPKNHRIRYIPISSSLRSLLLKSAKTEGYVFPNECGQVIQGGTVTNVLLRMCRRNKIRPIGWHTLRHTFASQLAMKGASLSAIKELLGHSSITMTTRYAHISSAALKNTVELLDSVPQPIQEKKIFGQQVVNNKFFTSSVLEETNVTSPYPFAQP